MSLKIKLSYWINKEKICNYSIKTFLKKIKD